MLISQQAFAYANSIGATSEKGVIFYRCKHTSINMLVMAHQQSPVGTKYVYAIGLLIYNVNIDINIQSISN